MAPIRPSIMSEGATISQPAAARASRLAGQGLERLVVDDDAVADDAVLAVGGVGVERHVADDADLGHLAA